MSYLLAYFVFQTGSFTAITFIATWFNHSFGLSLANISTAIIAIGAGILLDHFWVVILLNGLVYKRHLKQN